MGTCNTCNTSGRTISNTIGFCAECIRAHFDTVWPQIKKVHDCSRMSYGLPTDPPVQKAAFDAVSAFTTVVFPKADPDTAVCGRSKADAFTAAGPTKATFTTTLIRCPPTAWVILSALPAPDAATPNTRFQEVLKSVIVTWRSSIMPVVLTVSTARTIISNSRHFPRKQSLPNNSPEPSTKKPRASVISGATPPLRFCTPLKHLKSPLKAPKTASCAFAGKPTAPFRSLIFR